MMDARIREGQVSVTEEWSPDGTVKRTTKMDNSMPGEAELLLKMLSLAPPEAAEVVEDAQAQASPVEGEISEVEDSQGEGKDLTLGGDEVVAEQAPAMQEDDQEDVKGRVSEGSDKGKDFKRAARSHGGHSVGEKRLASVVDHYGKQIQVGDILESMVGDMDPNSPYKVIGLNPEGREGYVEVEIRPGAVEQERYLLGKSFEKISSKRMAYSDWDRILRKQRGVEGYVAAIKDPKTGETIWGNPGETHGDIIIRYWKEKNYQPSDVEVFLETVGRGDIERGFIDREGDGRFLTQNDMQRTMGVDPDDDEKWMPSLTTEDLPSFQMAARKSMKKNAQRGQFAMFDDASNTFMAGWYMGGGEMSDVSPVDEDYIVRYHGKETIDEMKANPGKWMKLEEPISSFASKLVAFEIGDHVEYVLNPDHHGTVVDKDGEKILVKWMDNMYQNKGEETLVDAGKLEKRGYRRYSGDPYWMTLKYPATCKRCGKQMQPGERAFRFKDGSMFCEAPDCGQRESDSFESAAQDEDMMGGGMYDYGMKKRATSMDIKNEDDLMKALSYGSYSDDGYALVFNMGRGASVCPDCIRKNIDKVLGSGAGQPWTPLFLSTNTDDMSLRCDVCGKDLYRRIVGGAMKKSASSLIGSFSSDTATYGLNLYRDEYDGSKFSLAMAGSDGEEKQMVGVPGETDNEAIKYVQGHYPSWKFSLGVAFVPRETEYDRMTDEEKEEHFYLNTMASKKTASTYELYAVFGYPINEEEGEWEVPMDSESWQKISDPQVEMTATTPDEILTELIANHNLRSGMGRPLTIREMEPGVYVISEDGGPVWGVKKVAMRKRAGYSVRDGRKIEIEPFYDSLSLVSASGEAYFEKPPLALIEDKVIIGDNGSVTVFRGKDTSGVTGLWWELEGAPESLFDKTAMRRKAGLQVGDHVEVHVDETVFDATGPGGMEEMRPYQEAYNGITGTVVDLNGDEPGEVVIENDRRGDRLSVPKEWIRKIGVKRADRVSGTFEVGDYVKVKGVGGTGNLDVPEKMLDFNNEGKTGKVTEVQPGGVDVEFIGHEGNPVHFGNPQYQLENLTATTDNRDVFTNRMVNGMRRTASVRTAQSAREYLETFFEEKQLPHQSWDIEDESGTMHYIDSSVVIEALLNAPQSEQEQAADVIRRIDFANGDVNDFLKHLAKGLVANNPFVL